MYYRCLKYNSCCFDDVTDTRDEQSKAVSQLEQDNTRLKQRLQTVQSLLDEQVAKHKQQVRVQPLVATLQVLLYSYLLLLVLLLLYSCTLTLTYYF